MFYKYICEHNISSLTIYIKELSFLSEDHRPLIHTEPRECHMTGLLCSSLSSRQLCICVIMADPEGESLESWLSEFSC